MRSIIDEDFKPLMKMLENWGLEVDWTDALFKSIGVKRKEYMYLYNYKTRIEVAPDDPVLSLCRGLVLGEDGKPLNFPFRRFFNYFQETAAPIDWDSAEVQEKIDGSLVCAFWNGEAIEITTRNSFYPDPTSTSGADFSKLFRKMFKDEHDLLHDHCYMFELVSQENRVVTRYAGDSLYLIGMRELFDGFKERKSDLLDDVAGFYKVKRPRSYKAANIEQCIKLFEDMPDDQEGLVVLDQYFNRIKIKQESYLKLAKAKSMNNKALFEAAVLNKFELDEEMLKGLPDVQNRLEDMRRLWDKVYRSIVIIYRVIELAVQDRKAFAVEATKYPFSSVLFNLKDGKDLKIGLTLEKVLQWAKYLRIDTAQIED